MAAIARLGLALVAFVMLGLAAAGCSFIPGSAGYEGPWLLVSIDGRPPAADPIGEARIEFAGDRVSGSDGCNSFSGRYEVAGAEIRFIEVAQTLIGCDGALGEQGGAFGAVFAGPTRLDVGGDRLSLIGPAVRLDFDRLGD
jgi:heat shock protein HslJ